MRLAVKLLCKKLGKHKVVRSTSGMSWWCEREGCNWRWDYD